MADLLKTEPARNSDFQMAQVVAMRIGGGSEAVIGPLFKSRIEAGITTVANRANRSSIPIYA
jgi:hypothetical protein